MILPKITLVRCFVSTTPSFSLRSHFVTQNRFRYGSSSLCLSSSTKRSRKKRIVFLGSPPVAAETLQTLHQASQHPESLFDIVAVISQPAKRGKRGAVEDTAVSKMAKELSIPLLLTPEKANDPSFLEQLANEIRPHLCITAAYGQYLPKAFLATPEFGTVNIHPSLLPRWRGASPVQRSLEAGDNPVGVTVLYTVSKMDAGPIITQQSLWVTEKETATTVLPKLFQLGTESLLSVLLDLLQGAMTMEQATPQIEDHATHAKLIENSEAELRVWKESATVCHNRLRGFHMWPKVFMYVQICSADDEEQPAPIKLKIHETRVVHNLQLAPTDVIQLGPDKSSGLYVVCGDGSILELLVVQPPSKSPFPARDLIHGYPNATLRWYRPEEAPTQPISNAEAVMIENQ